MPFVAGETLRQRLSRERQLPIEDAVGIVRQVAAALQYAHAQGVIHRDIKPENILLHEGEAMVTDFGIALAVGAAPSDRLTETGLMVGTPEYMSPEQAAGEPTLDARSDVYSLGCVLYELLAGEPPHTGASARMVIAKRFTDAIPRVRRLRPTVPPGVEDALVEALAIVPADRFGSVAAFADALAAPARGKPRPPSVAVLPFLNLSRDPDNEFFADGITEDVIAQLSKIRSLKVISRTSVMPFKNRERTLRDIGSTLEVATLVEGSVRRVGDRCGSSLSSSTRKPTGTCGPKPTTASSPISSRSRPMSPSRSPPPSRRSSRRPNERGSAGNRLAISTRTSFTCRGGTATGGTPK